MNEGKFLDIVLFPAELFWYIVLPKEKKVTDEYIRQLKVLRNKISYPFMVVWYILTLPYYLIWGGKSDGVISGSEIKEINRLKREKRRNNLK